MVRMTLCAKTPENIIALRRKIYRFVSLSTMAEATPANIFTTTVVVRNQVVLVINRIAAGADPGNG